MDHGLDQYKRPESLSTLIQDPGYTHVPPGAGSWPHGALRPLGDASERQDTGIPRTLVSLPGRRGYLAT